jgi:hypothetical protein
LNTNVLDNVEHYKDMMVLIDNQLSQRLGDLITAKLSGGSSHATHIPGGTRMDLEESFCQQAANIMEHQIERSFCQHAANIMEHTANNTVMRVGYVQNSEQQSLNLRSRSSRVFS